MSTRELIENYTAYTDAVEMSHSAAAETTARTTPICTVIASEVISFVLTGDFSYNCWG